MSEKKKWFDGNEILNDDSKYILLNSDAIICGDSLCANDRNGKKDEDITVTLILNEAPLLHSPSSAIGDIFVSMINEDQQGERVALEILDCMATSLSENLFASVDEVEAAAQVIDMFTLALREFKKELIDDGE